jgi:nucleoside-diphosphate-sugar epimerase
MKILIIGGTGNISIATTKQLIERGDEVVLFNRGTQPVEGTRQITGDRCNYTQFEAQMGEEGYFDCVIDMVAYHPDDAKSAVRAFAGRTGQFIFCSTVDVYTKPAATFPIREDFERSPNPVFEYAYHKVLCENILLEASAQGGFPLTILRPGATYNDSWAPISLIGSGTALLRRIRMGMPVIVLGDGTSFWTSSHRDDVGHAFANAAGNANAIGKTYNLTGDEWITWRSYFNAAAKGMSAAPIQFVPVAAELLARITHGAANWSLWNFQYNNIFDNSASKADLGFAYTIPWEEGARRMITYHDARGEIDAAQPDPLYEKVLEVYAKHAALMEEEI